MGARIPARWLHATAALHPAALMAARALAAGRQVQRGKVAVLVLAAGPGVTEVQRGRQGAVLVLCERKTSKT